MMQTSPTLIRLLLPRLNAVLFILLFLSVLSLGPQMLNIDGDLPRHLLMGKVVTETRSAPTQEIFSYVYEDRPYTPHEWLAGVIYYAIYLLFGLNGVVLLAAILIASAFRLLYSEAIAQEASYGSTFLLMLLGSMVTSIHWVVRPHLFTMLFLAIWLIWVDRLYRGGSLKVWLFPTLMLFWANIHAEFIAGFLVLIAYVAGCLWDYFFKRSYEAVRTARKLVGITLLSFIASIFNPVGLRTWDIVFGYISNRYLLSRITETRPPDFSQPEYLPLLILLGVSIILLVRKWDKFPSPHFFLLAGFGVMSLLSARNAHLSGLVFPYVLATVLAGSTGSPLVERMELTFRRLEGQLRGEVFPIALTILISALLMFSPLGNINRFEPSVFPVDAVQWLENNPQKGRMFNAFDWGGYILFHLWPEHKVFIESQTDVTGDVTKQYETVLTLQDGWESVFKRYDIRWVILPPDWPLTAALSAQGWDPIYQDQTAVILIEQ